ncbi:formyltransferase family protein [Enhygromyxa salina]|uniref:phosphoribosylglycinamide formyltransferase 1 n=1 Tax=Enhygromyxa salina TaxID=215803 RepID=A0A2S9YN50_9BACT|nr:formyltransferase family protein [Enhygromyxa salina]PRQ06523.1 Phosphoribosylglycinamide formyltransferase [Enhygromyxa salina]
MTSTRTPFVFLVLEDHPYGREMLRALLHADLLPLAVIEERSTVAEEEAAKFTARMAGLELAPSFAELLASHEHGHQVERLAVPNHNAKVCAELVAARAPKLLVLGGTRILRERIFALADHTLNAHPGLLPEVRGSASVAWAIETDVEVGCTCHFIDAGVDTGEIVSRERIPVHRGDSYELLCWKTTRLSATLMCSAVRAYFDGSIRSTPQPPGGATYRNMCAEGVARVQLKLAEGRYPHLVDEVSGLL